MLFTGCFNRSLDEKLRVAIPKRFREVMQCGDSPSRAGSAVVYVTPGTDGSLAIYTEEAFGRWGERLSQAPPTRQDVRAFSRLFYGQAQCVEFDTQGRVRIPSELATLANLTKEVVLVGVQDHLELWSAERWKSYLADKQSQYDQIAEAAFDGPAGVTS